MRTIGANYLLRNAGLMSLGRGISAGSGLVLDALIMAWFGLSATTDAFFAALAVPFLIGATLEFQMPKILVPWMAQKGKENEGSIGEREIGRLVGQMLFVFIIIFGAVSFLLGVSAPVLIPLQVPGLSEEGRTIAVHLAWVLGWLALIRSVNALLQAVMYGRHRYGIPAVLRLVNNVVVLAVVLTLQQRWGIESLAYGFILGGLSQTLVLFVSLWREGFRVGWEWRGWVELLGVFRMMGYPLAGHLVGESKTLLENFLASFFASGSLSVIRYASRIVHTISGVLLGGVVVSTLPLISHYQAEGRMDEVKRVLIKGVKMLALMALPVMVWLIVMGDGVMAVLFERGRFTREDAVMVSWVLALLTPYMLFSRMGGVMQSPFYAGFDTKTPFWVMLSSLVVHVGLAVALGKAFGVMGIAAAASITAFYTVVVLNVLLRKRWGAVGWEGLRNFSWKVLGVVGVMAGVLGVGRWGMGFWEWNGFWGNGFSVVVPSIMGFGVCGVCCYFFGIFDGETGEWFRRKWNKRFGGKTCSG